MSALNLPGTNPMMSPNLHASQWLFSSICNAVRAQSAADLTLIWMPTPFCDMDAAATAIAAVSAVPAPENSVRSRALRELAALVPLCVASAPVVVASSSCFVAVWSRASVMSLASVVLLASVVSLASVLPWFPLASAFWQWFWLAPLAEKWPMSLPM